MVITVLLFILGLILLIKGGDWFVDGATGIAQRFHIPEILIGATVVSIGTTLPEVMVSATSAMGGHGEIAYGNAIGSIICNTAFIAALSITIKPAPVQRYTLRTPVMFFFLSAVFYMYTAYIDGFFSRVTGIILLGIFLIYMILTVLQMTRDPEHPELAPDGTAITNEEEIAEETRTTGKNLFLLVLGAALIAVGANLLVDNGILIAQALGVPESVIALTFVALGTSLPELVTAVTSLLKGHGSMSIGNVIGANLFNIVLVSGTSIVLAPFDIPQSATIAGKNASLVVDIPVMLTVMVILTVPALIRKKLSRTQGILLLLIYVTYCIFEFTL